MFRFMFRLGIEMAVMVMIVSHFHLVEMKELVRFFGDAKPLSKKYPNFSSKGKKIKKSKGNPFLKSSKRDSFDQSELSKSLQKFFTKT